MEQGCLFCKITNKEIQTEFLYENNAVVAFKDIQPKAPVHLLIVPKEHVHSIAHLEPLHGELVTHLVFTAQKLAAERNLSDYKLVFNVGREGGQSIDHLHLHLLGGWSPDEIGSGTSLYL